MRLTDISIRAIKPPEKGQKTYYDDTLAGFGVRVSHGGTKSFVLIRGKERKRVTIGRYPNLTLSQARTEAKQLLVHQPHQNLNMSYSDASEAFLDECSTRNRPKTVSEYRRYLHSLDYDGSIRNITRHHLRQQITHPHTLNAFKIFFNWAIRNDLIDRNPVAGDRVTYNQARNRVLTENELGAIFTHAQDYPNPFGGIISLCILTGQRRGEVAQLKWGYIKDDTITLPAALSKNGREHTFPYSHLTQSILDTIERRGDYVFLGRNGGFFNGWSKAKSNFDPLHEHWTLHDLRRTFASVHAQLGTPIHVVERLLNHVSGSFGGLVSVYNRYSYMAEMKAAAAV